MMVAKSRAIFDNQIVITYQMEDDGNFKLLRKSNIIKGLKWCKQVCKDPMSRMDQVSHAIVVGVYDNSAIHYSLIDGDKCERISTRSTSNTMTVVETAVVSYNESSDMLYYDDARSANRQQFKCKLKIDGRLVSCRNKIYTNGLVPLITINSDEDGTVSLAFPTECVAIGSTSDAQMDVCVNGCYISDHYEGKIYAFETKDTDDYDQEWMRPTVFDIETGTTGWIADLLDDQGNRKLVTSGVVIRDFVIVMCDDETMSRYDTRSDTWSDISLPPIPDNHLLGRIVH